MKPDTEATDADKDVLSPQMLADAIVNTHDRLEFIARRLKALEGVVGRMAQEDTV